MTQRIAKQILSHIFFHGLLALNLVENYVGFANEFQNLYIINMNRLLMKTQQEYQWRIQDTPRWGANPQGGGGTTYEYAKFSQKLHEIKRIWTGGRVSLAPP